MFAEPVKEIANLHHRKHLEKDRKVSEGEQKLAVKGDLLHILAEFDLDQAKEVGFLIRGVPIRYDVRKQLLSCGGTAAPLAPHQGKIKMEILVDRGSIEVFGNQGRVAISTGGIAKGKQSLKVISNGGSSTLRTLVIHELRSAWNMSKE